ncbi:MAG TPA: secretin N-terminal domain-containing protein [Candidatus Rifleibacterium sp.]|nr:secretin N-terminal domain-containing protein [Candidatus Rifleibacterium sp.]
MPENGLLARLHALAARARLNLIVNAPDHIPGDFKPSESQNDIEQLLAIADAADCTADQAGSVWLITARERQIFQNSSGWKLFYPSYGPAESLLAHRDDSHGNETRVFMAPSVNACIISGEHRRSAAAVKNLRSLEKPAVPAELHLDIAAGNSPQQASISLQLLTNTEFFLGLAGPEFEPIVATCSLACDASGSFSLAIDNAGKNLHSQSLHGAQQQNPLILKSNDGAVTINWTARLIRPFPQKTAETDSTASGRDRLKTAMSQPDSTASMHLALPDEPFDEILGRIAASESCNLAIDRALSGNLSVFFFGSDLYFEEQFNLIARSVGGSVRKIGNTWLVAPENRFFDTFEFGYNITKRLQYADSEAVAATLKACLADLKAPASCRVAADKAINAIILAGSPDIIDSLGKLLFELDRPPVLFDSRLSLRSDSGDFSETFGINTGRVSSRQIELRDVAAAIELLPVSFPHLTGPGLKAQTSLKLKSGLELKLVFWSELPESDSRPLLSFKSSSSASLFLSGSRSDLQFEDHRYFPHESEDCKDNETDDAFESAF